MRSITTELTIFDYLDHLDSDNFELTQILARDAIKNLVFKNPKCLTSQFNNQTPLVYAILNNKPNATEYLLDLFRNVSRLDVDYFKVIEPLTDHVIEYNDEKTLQQLLQVPALNPYFVAIIKNDTEMFQQLSKVDTEFSSRMNTLYDRAHKKQAFAILDYMINQHPDFPPVNQGAINSNPQINPEYTFTETTVKHYLQNQPVMAGEKILPLLIRHNQWNLIASQLIAVADNPWWMSRLLFVCIASEKTDFALFLIRKKPEIALLKQQNISLLTHIIEHTKVSFKVGNASNPLLNELQANHKDLLKTLIHGLTHDTFINIPQKNLWHFLLFVLKEFQNPAIQPSCSKEALMQCLDDVVRANHLLCAEMILNMIVHKFPKDMFQNLLHITKKYKSPEMYLLLTNSLANAKGYAYPSDYLPITTLVDFQKYKWEELQQPNVLGKPAFFNKHIEEYLNASFDLLQAVLVAPDSSDELKTFIKALVRNISNYGFKDKIKYPGSPCVPPFNMKLLEPENLDRVLQHPDYLFLDNCNLLLKHIYALYHWLSTTHKTIKASNWQVPNRFMSGYKPGMPDNMGDIEKVLQNLDTLDHPFRVVGLYFHVKHLFMQIPVKSRHPDTNMFYTSKKTELLQHAFPMQPPSAEALLARDRAIKNEIDDFEQWDNAKSVEDTIDEFVVLTTSKESVPDGTVEASVNSGTTSKKPGFFSEQNKGPQVNSYKEDEDPLYKL